jgi:hypothetical protein
MAIPPTDDASIQILLTNYDIITDFLNLAFCSENFISIKHRILATFNINKKLNFDSLCAFNKLRSCYEKRKLFQTRLYKYNHKPVKIFLIHFFVI